jgi:hypothetical protein
MTALAQRVIGSIRTTRKIDDAVGAILARAAAATMGTQSRARFVNLAQALCNHPMLNNGRCAQCGVDPTAYD